MRLAAIDIGSNAARLLISELISAPGEKPVFNKLNLVRVPLRLGFDVFENGSISPQRTDMMLHTMKAFRELLDAYEVKHLMACATSAMRDAKNAPDITKKIKAETGIDIEVISGSFEAAIIYENHIAESLDVKKAYLYIDVGGGSTELTFFAKGKLVSKESFNIGTIRLLKNQVTDKNWDAVKDYLKKNTKGYGEIEAIGSGGNINKIFSLTKKKDGKPMLLDELKEFYKTFSLLTVSERIRQFGFREDRADVIVPALQIFINVMRWVDAKEVYVPKIGLADGLIQHLYNELMQDEKAS